MKLIVTTLLLVFGMSAALHAQEDTTEGDWRLYPANIKDTVKLNPDAKTSVKRNFKAVTDSSAHFDPSTSLDFHTETKGHSTISKDGRIDELIEFLGSERSPEPVQIEGYRVQIAFDQDRDWVLGEKARFMSNYPEYKAYMKWKAPNHSAHAGNFYTRQQALVLIEEIKDAFPSATLIKTMIDLPDLD